MSNLNENMSIDKHTECPYVGKCDIASDGECYHKGIKHEVEFSCAMARLYDILNPLVKEIENESKG